MSNSADTKNAALVSPSDSRSFSIAVGISGLSSAILFVVVSPYRRFRRRSRSDRIDRLAGALSRYLPVQSRGERPVSDRPDALARDVSFPRGNRPGKPPCPWQAGLGIRSCRGFDPYRRFSPAYRDLSDFKYLRRPGACRGYHQWNG
jgi:hypothetical protein